MAFIGHDVMRVMGNREAIIDLNESSKKYPV